MASKSGSVKSLKKKSSASRKKKPVSLQLEEVIAAQSISIEPIITDRQTHIEASVSAAAHKKMQRLQKAKKVFKNFKPSWVTDDIRAKDPSYIKPGLTLNELRAKELSFAKPVLNAIGPTKRAIHSLPEHLRDQVAVTPVKVSFDDARPLVIPRPHAPLSPETLKELSVLIRKYKKESRISESKADAPSSSGNGAPPAGSETNAANSATTPQRVLDFVRQELESLKAGAGSVFTGEAATGEALQGELKALTVPGPSDQPAIREFTELRIGFPWVWSEVYDDEFLTSLLLKIYGQLSSVQAIADELPSEISSLDALRPLLEVAQELANDFADGVTVYVPDLVRALGLEISTPEWNQLTLAERLEIDQIADEYAHVNRTPVSDITIVSIQPHGNNQYKFKFSKPESAGIFFAPVPPIPPGGYAGTVWVKANDLAQSAISLNKVSGTASDYILPGSSCSEMKIGSDIFVEVGEANKRTRAKLKNQAQDALNAARYRLSQQSQEATETPGGPATLKSALEALLTIINNKEYAFRVFPEASVNFGLLLTYQQEWEPLTYQVGDLVKTIPLAPRESRKYSVKIVNKRERSQKEIENALKVARDEAQNSSRAETEIARRAQNSTNFKATAEGKAGIGVVEVGGGVQFGTDSSKESSRAKKNFRESVVKNAHEYSQSRTVEISTTHSEETENVTSGEICNPNEEITVTYLFYELARRYRLREKLHAVTPVVLVGSAVPRPDQIKESWLLRHDWILKRVLLDDSFRGAFDLIRESDLGRNVELGVLKTDLERKSQAFSEIKDQLVTNTKLRDAAIGKLRTAVDKTVAAHNAAVSDTENMTDSAVTILTGGLFGNKGLFGSGGASTGPVADDPEGAEARQQAAEEALSRMDEEIRQVMSRLEGATVALDASITRYVDAVRKRLDKELAIARLRSHIIQNILHYMQAIWEYEPTDQRFLRLYDIPIPMFGGDVQVSIDGNGQASVSLSAAGIGLVNPPSKRLSEIADLDRLLGFKGNYMIFEMREHNYLTAWMTQEYLGADGQVSDPDQSIDVSVSESRKLKQMIQAQSMQTSPALSALLASLSDADQDEVETEITVPTNMLYIEALPGTHPVLENFKLAHRQLDARKVFTEIQREEIENIRRKARLLKMQLDDADIDKIIRVDGAQSMISVDQD